MTFHRFFSGLIVLGIVGAFLYVERFVLPVRLALSVREPFPVVSTAPERLSSLLAPEPSDADFAAAAAEGVVVVKRAWEEPDTFSLTPPLADTLVSVPSVEQWTPLPLKRGGELFPKPRSIEVAVSFWKSIYAQYTSEQVVIHDNQYLDRIYAVLNFEGLADRGFSDEALFEFKKERVEEKIAEIDDLLKRLDQISGTAQPLHPALRKIWKLWSFLEEDPKRFAKARKRLRSQTGLANRFREAMIVAGAYFPHMEDIFAGHHLPAELTRLVFVESMFHNTAISKAGAAGLWQFMPATARLYGLKMSEWVDERFDPLLATQAAARLLYRNYQVLGTWPLAVNAYNSGPGRLRSAIRKMGTDDIGVIINRYEGSGYGFASRNFYPEFLAALEVSDHYQQFFGDLPLELPIEFEVVKLPDQVTFHELADIIRIDLGSLRDLNPAFLPPAFNSDVYLPKESTVRVPLGEGSRVIAGVYNLARQNRAADVSGAFPP